MANGLDLSRCGRGYAVDPRYYYDFNYDWARLEYLRAVYERLLPVLHKDLDRYVDFLLVLASEGGD